MSAILLIGEDEFLLETRAAVLRVTGAELAHADLTTAFPMLQARRFDVVIICHSVAGHVCQTLSDIIRENWPGTRILHISDAHAWEADDGGLDLCSSEPAALIARTIELLGRRPMGRVRPETAQQRSA